MQKKFYKTLLLKTRIVKNSKNYLREFSAYKQIYGNFIENMSIIDLLFNEGENSKKFLTNTKIF